MFIRPCEGRVTSPFGWRKHPVTGKNQSWHQGVDLAKSGNIPIYSSAAGTVTRVGVLGTYGNVVMIVHNIGGKTYETNYAHLHSFAVKVGQKVKQGQRIGRMGTTGRSTGQHLHFEIHIGRWATGQPNAVNPMDYITIAPSLGAIGDDVKELQGLLVKIGYLKVVDGSFGPATESAVKSFQNVNKLAVDGKAGPATMAALLKANEPKKPVASVEPKKEEEKLDLTKEQRQELAAIFKVAREKGIYKSTEHEKSIVAGTMTISRLLYLQSVIAGAALNGGKRVG